MNMNLYGHHGQWLMVDCGVMFNSPLDAGSQTLHEVVTADPSFIADRKDQLAGIVITHAHEDHLGALAHLWHHFSDAEHPISVYATKFTAELFRRKLAQQGLSGKVPIVEVDINGFSEIGVFRVQWLEITHSIPEPHALVIQTDAGSVFHTADWKIDPNPILGQPFNEHAFKKLAAFKIDAMVCDSTNSTVPGRSISEGDCYQGLKDVIDRAENRAIVCCFGSNVARLVTLARIAQETGRHIALLGRSLQNNVSAAQVSGVWPADLPVIEAGHIAYLPREEVLAIATGSQGEPRTALNRLAADTHYDLELESGDTVIFSSKVIPGNEVSIEKVIQNLVNKGINIIESENTEKPIHASGHPCADELVDLYQWVQPQIAIPVHGEERHLHQNAIIAKNTGVPEQLIGQNGDLYKIAPRADVVRQAVKTGRIAIKQ